MADIRPPLATQGWGEYHRWQPGVSENQRWWLRVAQDTRWRRAWALRAALIAADRGSGQQRRGRPMISVEDYAQTMIIHDHCCSLRGLPMSPFLQFTVSLSLTPVTL